MKSRSTGATGPLKSADGVRAHGVQGTGFSPGLEWRPKKDGRFGWLMSITPLTMAVLVVADDRPRYARGRAGEGNDPFSICHR